MHLTRIFFPTALVAISALGAGTACTATDDDRTGEARAAQTQDGAGNPGTVKIKEYGASGELPDNDTKVGCRLQIEFRGYDEGDLEATWRIDAQPPTGTRTIASGSVYIGEDPAGGANDLDAVETIDLASYDRYGLEMSPTQGYHVRLVVETKGPKGVSEKSKVFWAKCDAPPPPPPAPQSPPPP